jgi:hypothetical protein
MNTLPQILVVGRDRMLLQAHRLILGTYFDVEAAGRVSEACGLISRQDFDVIVMCDTLSEGECRQIADMVRDQSPQSTLFSLLGPGNRDATSTFGRTIADAGPLQLLKECAELLGFDLQGKQRQFSN